MRTLMGLMAVASCCFGEAPYPPSGTKPRGALLVLPTEYGPRNATSTERPRGDNYQNLEDETARLMERLRQEQGSERGVYHVYLQDGRLQRVQYTAAPIRPAQQVQQVPPVILSPEYASKRGVYFVQVPDERIQALQASKSQPKYKQSYQTYSSAQYSSQYRQQENEPSSFLASVQYSEVEPIRGPVYSYKPQPLTRILRYAPVF